MFKEEVVEALMECYRDGRMVPIDLLAFCKQIGITCKQRAALKYYVQEVELDPERQDAETE